MIEVMAFAIVVAAGLFFVALGGMSLVAPSNTSRFLLGFAGSPSKHYAELALRFVVGGAFVFHARQMLFSTVFSIFGWILLVTTAVLLLVPWRWHHRFAQRSVPEALRVLPLVGVSSIALGGLVLVAAFRNIAA